MYRLEPKIINDNEEQNPYIVYQTMEDLIDKLNILNYNELIKELNIKPLSRHYFVVAKNPGEQFYMFTSLAAWLIRKVGKNFEQPQEYDDPNSTIAGILNHLRDEGVRIDFPPNKLKQGVGEQVVFVLDNLANAALKYIKFEWQQPIPEEEIEPEVETVEDEGELILDKVEEEMAAVYSDESDDEQIFHVDDLIQNKKQVKTDENKKLKDILTVDQEAWRLEVERVLPQLKVTIKGDNRDWRNHLEQIQTYRKAIEEVLVPTKTQLDKLHVNISSTLEKIENRELYLNQDLESVLEKYRVLQNELSKLQDNYNSINGGVTLRTRELAKLTDQLENVKMQMEERGTSMTDGTPLVNIRKSIANVKQEIFDMEMRMEIVSSTLLQSKVRELKKMENDIKTPSSSSRKSN